MSMFPTLNNGNSVLVNKFSYLFKRPKINDIIAVKDPRDNKVLIKRIARSENKNFFVVGDNEKKSTDSREFGMISRRDIVGKVIYIRRN